MGLTPRRLLEYFSVDDLKFILSTINESQSGSRDELVERVIIEWPDHNKKWEHLLEFFEKKSTIVQICIDYSIDHRGDRGLLERRIKKELQGKNKKTTQAQTAHHFLPIPRTKRDWGKVSIIVALIIGIPNLYLAMSPAPSEQCIHGESGLIYKDCSLYFEISKPNRDWKFSDFNINSAPKLDFHFSGQSIVSGILVERTLNEKVIVVVFDDEADLNLQAFMDKELDVASELRIPIQITYTLPDENEDELLIKTKIFTSLDFQEQIADFKERIIKKDDRVYIVHSEISSIKEASERAQLETDKIFNSFRFIDSKS